MRTMGIRVAPKEVTFAIYDSDSKSLVNVEEIKVPAAFTVPDALKYIRNNILDVLREFHVSKAGIRVSEGSAQTINITRVQIEGVIQEAFASSNLDGYYIGQIASISSRIKISRTDFKPLVRGTIDYDIENWHSMSQEQREAILCAVGD
jgi:hypothetical protein